MAEYVEDDPYAGAPAPTKASAKGGKAAPAGAIPTEDSESSYSDHAWSAASAGVGMVGDTLNYGRKLATRAGAKTLADNLDYLAEGAYSASDSAQKQMSEAGRRNASGKLTSLEGEDSVLGRDSKIDKSSYLTNLGVSTVPSVGGMAMGVAGGAAIGSVVPGIGTAVGGVIGGIAAGTAMQGGQINREIYKEIAKASPDQLGERYKELRAAGQSDRAARLAMTDEAGGWIQDTAALGSGALNMFGPVGGRILQMLTKGGVGKGVREGIVKGGAKEAGQELVDSGSGELAKQAALNKDFGVAYKPGEIVEQAATGALAGAGMGAALHRRAPASQDQNAALAARNTQPNGGQAATPAAEGEVIPTKPPSGDVGEMVEAARAAATQTPVEGPPAGPAPPPITQGPVPQEAISAPVSEAIPTGPEPMDPMQNRREMMRTGAQDEARGLGPLPTVDPMADRRDAMRPGEGSQPGARAPGPMGDASLFVAKMAEVNNGTVDPDVIAGYLSQRMGRTVSREQVLQELAPMVEQGVLTQRSIPGIRGAPTFGLADQGPRDQRPPETQGPPELQGPREPVAPVAAVPVPGPTQGPELPAPSAVGVPGPALTPAMQRRAAAEASPTVAAPTVAAPRQAAGPKAKALKAKAADKPKRAPETAPVPAGATVKIKGGSPGARDQARGEIGSLLQKRAPAPSRAVNVASAPAAVAPVRAAPAPASQPAAITTRAETKAPAPQAKPVAAAPKAEAIKAKSKARSVVVTPAQAVVTRTIEAPVKPSEPVAPIPRTPRDERLDKQIEEQETSVKKMEAQRDKAWGKQVETARKQLLARKSGKGREAAQARLDDILARRDAEWEGAIAPERAALRDLYEERVDANRKRAKRFGKAQPAGAPAPAKKVSVALSEGAPQPRAPEQVARDINDGKRFVNRRKFKMAQRRTKALNAQSAENERASQSERGGVMTVARAFKAKPDIAKDARAAGMEPDDLVNLILGDIQREISENERTIDDLPIDDLLERAKQRAAGLQAVDPPFRMRMLENLRQARLDVETMGTPIEEALENAKSRAPERQGVAPAVPVAETGPGSPRYVPTEEGVTENPARAFVDNLQEPARREETEAALAAQRDAQLEREARKMKNAGVAPVELDRERPMRNKTGKNAWRTTAVGFVNPDGSMKKWEHIKKAAAKIFEKQSKQETPAHKLILDIMLYERDVAGLKGKALAPFKARREALENRIRNGEWDRDASERYAEARDTFMERTPSWVFNEFAPEPGVQEDGQDAVQRIEAMANTFRERQGKGFGKGNQNIDQGNVRVVDPYGKFMRDVLRLTNDGSLRFENDLEVRRRVEAGELNRANKDMATEIAKSEKRRGRPLTPTEVSQMRKRLGKRAGLKLDAKEEAGLQKVVQREIERAHRIKELVAHEMLLRDGDVALYSLKADVNSGINKVDGESVADAETTSDGRFFAAHAEMLETGFDDGVLELGDYTVAEALQATIDNGGPKNGYYEMLSAALKARVPDVKVEVLTPAALSRYKGNTGNAAAHYDPVDNVIRVRAGLTAAQEKEAILHEAVHAATAYGLRTPELRKMANSLRADAKAWMRANGYTEEGVKYLGSVDELVAWGFTSARFRADLATAKLSDATTEAMGLQKGSSALQGFIDLVRRVLGMTKIDRNPTMLEGIVHLGGLSSNIRRPDGRPFGERDGPMEWNADVTMGRVAEMAGQTTANASPALRRFKLGLQYGTDLVENYRSLFKFNPDKKVLRMPGTADPMDQFQQAGGKKVALAKNIQDAYMPMINRMREYQATNPVEAKQAYDLAIDATTFGLDPTRPDDLPPPRALQANVNGRRAMRNWKALKARYDALSPEGQAVFASMPQLVKTEARLVALETMRNIAANRWQDAHLKRSSPTAELPSGVTEEPPSFAELDAMAKRLVEGQGTVNDIAAIGPAGEAVLDELRSRLNSQQFYIPLSRYGEFVVTGFRTDFQKTNYFDTEAEAEAFADRAEAAGVPLVRDINVSTFDPKGERVPSSERAGRTDLARKWRVELQTQITEMFETASEAESRRKEYAAMPNVQMSAVEPRARGTFSGHPDLDPNLQARITKAVEAMASNEEDRQSLHNQLSEVFVRLSPGANMRHASIKRRNVTGASTDLLRTMGAHVIAAGRYRAGLRFQPYQKGALAAQADNVTTNRYGPGGAQNAVRLDVIAEQRKRLTQADDDGRSNPVMSAVSRYVSIHYLASPSYTILQLTQTPLMAPGVFASLHPKASMGEIVSALGAAHNAVGGISDTVWKSGRAGLVRAIQTYRNKPNAPVNLIGQVYENMAETLPAAKVADYKSMLQELVERGHIDEAAGLEVARVTMPSTNKFARAFAMVEDLSRSFPAAAEVYNRASVAIASYQLGLDKGMTRDEAIEAADLAIRRAHFVYNAENAPRLMNQANKLAGGVLSPFLTFKKYVAAVYMQIARSAYLSIKGETPEIRTAMRRQFGYMMLAHGAAAGVAGLPWEIVKVPLGVAALLMGEDEPYDLEDAARKALVEQLGGGPDAVKAAGVIMKGLPRLANLDLSSRIGLENLIFGRGPNDFTDKGLKEYLANLVFGAAGGAVGGVFKGLKTLRDTGNMTKAAEQMAPKAIKDALQASEIISDGGLQDAKGLRIDDGLLGPTDAFWKAMGFNSGTQADVQADRSQRFNDDRIEKRDKGRLYKEITAARASGDARKIAAAEAKWAKWNADHPQNEITEKGLGSSASAAARARDPERTYLGVPIPKGGLKPSIYIPSRSSGPIMRGGTDAPQKTEDTTVREAPAPRASVRDRASFSGAIKIPPAEANELRQAIVTEAAALQMDPEDLATFISFETAGSLHKWKRGPTTKWGTHRGLIQWGEPQAREYGVTASSTITEQMAAVREYLLDRGYKPGKHGGLQAYAAVNAGHASKTWARDYAAGGTPGTVRDKWLNQMAGHRAIARELLKEV